ncbi:MAG: hypothetical protein LUD17_00875 [Bacteroidales bacterium]|nr:hypothetical protein [Bacteroidales bacterium]
MIETNEFRWKAGQVGHKLAVEWAWRWWWALALPLAAAAIAGLYDWRWWVVGLALVMVAYPGILAIVYYDIALSPETVRAILPQNVEFGPDSFTIIYKPYAEGCNTIHPLTVEYADVLTCSDNGSTMLITWPKGKVQIPFSAFPTPDDARSALQLVQSKNPNKN